MLGPESRVAVVGAGAAGVAVAEALRHEGYLGDVTIFGDETFAPYDRPPLSKEVLAGAWSLEQTSLRVDGHYQREGIRLSLGNAAVALDAEAKRIGFADGTSSCFDAIVIATGVTARRLPFGNDLHGVHVLRTARDLGLLQADLSGVKRLVVIGAGFLGAEAAAVARTLGHKVALVDPLAEVMIRQVGHDVGARISALHAAHGVDVRLSVGVQDIRGSGGAVSSVLLSDGSELSASVVLIAIGADPATSWLIGSGLRLQDGVVCDEYCRAAENIYVAGDVARWHNPRYGQFMRLEHRLNATEQGIAAATNLLHGDVAPYDPVPYFWSDQYNVKIQAHGILHPDAQIEVLDSEQDGHRFVVRYDIDRRPVGVLGWNRSRQARQYRQLWLDAPAAAD